jgi:hypothetical protein
VARDWGGFCGVPRCIGGRAMEPRISSSKLRLVEPRTDSADLKDWHHSASRTGKPLELLA